MIQTKTLSEERIKKIQRNSLIFFLFQILVTPFLITMENGMLILCGLFGVSFLVLPFLKKNNGKLETGYLQIDDKEVRVLDDSKNVVEVLPISGDVDLSYFKPKLNFFAAFYWKSKHPILKVRSSGNERSFTLLVDSKMKEKALEDRFALDKKPAVA